MTGEKKCFVANVTDRSDRILKLCDIARENGINAVMVNVMALGLSPVRVLGRTRIFPSSHTSTASHRCLYTLGSAFPAGS